MGIIFFDQSPSIAPAKRNGALRFDSLPKGRWWLRWVGDVAFHDRHVAKTQPTVSLVLQNADEGQAKELTSVRITVSQLWAARLGTLWVDKAVQKSSTGEEREITFSPRDLQPVAAGAVLPSLDGEGDFMIPFPGHPFHKEHTKSHCIGGFIGSVYYIFPVTELIRFYFGSSGGLLRKLFSADFSLQRLVHDASLVNTIAKVALPAEIPWTSAADVARILFSPAATKSATLISRSVTAGTASASPTQGVYANARFPFETKTVQRVRGIRLNAPMDMVERFLVLEILSCSAPFPFSTLKYTCASQSRRASTSGGEETGKGSAVVNRVASRGEPHKVGNQDAAKGLAPRIVVVSKAARFPDLLEKPVYRVDSPAPKQVQVRMLPPSALDGTGEGIASGQGRPIELAPEPDSRHSIHLMKCPVDSWALYFEWLKRLSEAPWVEALSFVRIHPGQARKHWAQLPEIIDDEGEVLEATRRLSRQEESNQAVRLASFANVKVRGRLSGLLSLHPRDPDSKNKVYLWPQQRILEPEALRAVLAACGTSNLREVPRHIELETNGGVDRTEQALEEFRGWVDT